MRGLGHSVTLGLVSAYLCGILLLGCSAGAPVRVLNKGATTVTACVGGPVVPASSPAGFIPYITTGAAHGVTHNLTVHANFHALMAAYTVLGIDAGASYRLLGARDAVPELTASARLIMFTDFYSLQSSRVYPDVAANASWEVAENTLLYVGSHVTLQPQPWLILVSPMTGIKFPLSSRVRVQGEFIWQAANAFTAYGVFKGQNSIGNYGSAGGFIGVEVSP